MFPNERQRLQVPAVYLLCAGTGARPGEFVDASVTLKGKRKRISDMWGPNPWDNPDNFDFQGGNHEREHGKRSKALCYEDVRIFLVRVEGKRPALAMDVRLAHHKGADNRPKP